MVNASLVEPLRVLVVADDPFVRTGLVTLLTERSDYVISGQVAAPDLSAHLNVYAPDVILWDMGWEPTNRLERLADMGQGAPPVVALLTDEGHAADAWAAGARGLFLRSAAIERIVAGLAAAARDLIVIDPALGRALFSARQSAITPPTETLTARESQVLQFLAEGLANKAIALRLGISESTVKFHVNAILGKLGAQSRTDAVVRATRLGLIIL